MILFSVAASLWWLPAVLSVSSAEKCPSYVLSELNKTVDGLDALLMLNGSGLEKAVHTRSRKARACAASPSNARSAGEACILKEDVENSSCNYSGKRVGQGVPKMGIFIPIKNK
ncbi:hypothetical protein PGT21_028847 [Puccinia graminis f. sp. tritici]|uniref:Uncharacterized protein n=1 Tax=Puccinia graminis f. sp. tritici TaxID=56615 RepID=A0A5B0P904_PUCGR|nr:hypothetical protein PGTUg99_006650 [Puccinia graminis f. sp. tritici]KAA1104641.1 hypothetical protein PGT21_028847 [Puccinia graminis f. sp. tritici]